LFLESSPAIVATRLELAIFEMAAPKKKSAELKIALEAAAAAAEISRGYYRGNFSVTTKEDLTPVTQADVECEQMIREIILSGSWFLR